MRSSMTLQNSPYKCKVKKHNKVSYFLNLALLNNLMWLLKAAFLGAWSETTRASTRSLAQASRSSLKVRRLLL